MSELTWLMGSEGEGLSDRRRRLTTPRSPWLELAPFPLLLALPPPPPIMRYCTTKVAHTRVTLPIKKKGIRQLYSSVRKEPAKPQKRVLQSTEGGGRISTMAGQRLLDTANVCQIHKPI